VEPSTLPDGGAATPRRLLASQVALSAIFRVIAVAIAALVALLVMHAYRQPGFLIDFVNLRLC